MTDLCIHGMTEATCADCNPPTPPPRTPPMPYAKSEQDAIARFVHANERDMLNPTSYWSTAGFAALCEAIPRHSPESIKLQVLSMSSMIGLGRGMHVQDWMREAWERTS